MKRIFLTVLSLLILVITVQVYACGRTNKALNINASKRYVVLFPMALPFTFMINAQKNIVGYSGFRKKIVPLFSGNLILIKKPDFIKKTVDAGSPMNPDTEILKKLKPSFAINSYFTKAANKRVVNLGIPIVSFGGSFGNIKRLLKDVLNLGRATGHKKEAINYVKYYKGILSYTSSKLKHIKSKPKVLYLSYQGPSGTRPTSGGGFDTIVNDIIEKAGGISVSKNVPGIFGTILTKDIIKWNPNYIMLGPGCKKSAIYGNKQLKNVSAVKHHMVFKVPSDGKCRYPSWYNAEKSSLGILWTAKILHPRVFKSLNLLNSAKIYYTRFWGINLNKLNIKGDMP